MAHFGYMLPEYQFVNYLVNDNIYSFELSLEKRTNGSTIYEQIYKYPSYGASVIYSTLGNDKVYGRMTAFFPYYAMHLLDSKTLGFNYQMGVGLCYVGKTFDLENNHQNIAMGSHVNIFYNLKFAGRLKMSKKIELTGGIAFNHLSNANIQVPNLGLNYLTVFSGVNFLPASKTAFYKNTVERLKPTNEIVVLPSIGLKKPRSLEDKAYVVSSFSVEYNRRQFRKFHFGCGLDFFYDSSMESEFESKENRSYKSKYDYRTGFHLAQEFVYDRLSLILQEGIYLLLKDELNNKPIYTRAMIRYKFSKHWMANLSMKSHLHILDYPELGVGFYW